MTPQRDFSSLQLLVQDVDQRETQLRWIDGENGDYSYKVLKEQLISAATELRAQLQVYLRCYMLDREAKETAAALLRLVRAGHNLFESLFLSENKFLGQSALAQYRELDATGPLKLTVKVDPTWMFPWSLVVPNELHEPEGGFDPDALDKIFWCLRHDLSISTFGAGVPRRRAIALEECHMMAVLHRRIYDSVTASLENDFERQWVDTLLDPNTGSIAFDSEQFRVLLSEVSNKQTVRLRFAYLLGHANGEKFQFSDNDEMSANVLAVKLSNQTNSTAYQHTILFLNGCETTAEGEHFSFTELVGRFTVAGLIGTEVKVPDRFAFRFALAFMHLVLCEGWTLRDALVKLRSEHLPISLAYSLYAADGLSIQPSTSDTQISAAALRGENYSKGQIKCLN